MANSTKTKAAITPDVKLGANYDEVMRHIADLSERINFVMETMQNHADEIKAQRDVVERLRTRMGI